MSRTATPSKATANTATPNQAEQVSVRQARAQYFADNDFGADGGYGDAWVDLSIGPVPFPFPNTPMRVRAVRYHDLHHLATGYRTDFTGELEIAAWEVGAGCGWFIVPWQLNLAGMGVGAWLWPRRLFRAFVRGRRSHSLYGLPFEPLLDGTVAQLRARVFGAPGSSAGCSSARAADALLFAVAVAAGVLAAVLSLALGLLTLPPGLLAGWLRRRSPRPQPRLG